MKKELTGNAKWLAGFSLFGAVLLAAGATVIPNVSSVTESTLSDVSIISAGDNSTQVFLKDGTKLVKGLNSVGQLGVNNGYENARKWVPSVNDAGEIKEVVSSSHSLALNSEGKAFTWGDGQRGALGNGSDSVSLSPQQISASYYFDKISSGENFAVAIDNFGKLYTWGNNDSGQLGVENVKSETRPANIVPDVRFSDVKAGKNYVLALDSEKHLWVWGNNDSGQLGNGNNDTVKVPTKLNDQVWNSIATNSTSTTSAGIDSNNKLYTWGSNDSGQLGNGVDWRQQQREENERVQKEKERIRVDDEKRKVSLIQQCQIEENQKAADKEAERVEKERQKAIEDAKKSTSTPTPKPTVTPTPTPTPTPTETPEPPVDCKKVVEDSFVYTDTSGLVPNTIPEPPLTGNVNTPTRVNSDRNYKTVAVGTHNGFAITINGSILEGWGSDENGQTGINTDEKTHTQVPVPLNDSKYSVVDVGDGFAAAIGVNQKLYTWGKGENGALGMGDTNTKNLVPTEIASNIKNVFLGTKTGFAINSAGKIVSWGKGVNGVLGDGEQKDKYSLTEVYDSSKTVAPSNNFTLALRGDGNLVAWGNNENGTFGNGLNTTKVSPKPTIDIISKFISIAVESYTSFAIDEKGLVWGWGSNDNGRLGVTGINESNRPILVPITAKAKKVTLSSTKTLIVDVNNSLWVSGENSWKIIPTDYDIKNAVITDTTIYILDNNGDVYSHMLDEEGNTFAKIGDSYKTIMSAGNGVLALKTDGSLWGWGSQYNIINSEEPKLIDDKQKYVTLSVSKTHALTLDENGVVYGWGTEPYGTFGNTVEPVDSPYPLPIRKATIETEGTK